MKQSQVEARTELTSLTQSDLNSTYVEEMLLSELTTQHVPSNTEHRALSAENVDMESNMETNADPVITQHVPLNTEHRALSAENVESGTFRELDADFVVNEEDMEYNITLEESVQMDGHNQPDGSDGQRHEGGNGNYQSYQLDGERGQSIPEGWNENHNFSNRDSETIQGIPEGGSGNSRFQFGGAENQGELARQNGHVEQFPNVAGTHSDFSGENEEFDEEMNMDETNNNDQAQDVEYGISDPSRLVENAMSGNLRTAIHAHTNENNIENDRPNQVGSMSHVSVVVSGDTRTAIQANTNGANKETVS